MMADDGFARAINPSHTPGDGDTVFALATGRWDGHGQLTMIGALAAEAMAEAIVRAVSQGGVARRRAVGAGARHGAGADQVSRVRPDIARRELRSIAA